MPPHARTARMAFRRRIRSQVWAEPQRAGYSTAVIGESDLDVLADRLSAAGIDHGGPQSGGGQRILQIADPDGNRIVFSGK